jgi:hypothetical protein
MELSLSSGYFKSKTWVRKNLFVDPMLPKKQFSALGTAPKPTVDLIASTHNTQRSDCTVTHTHSDHF